MKVASRLRRCREAWGRPRLLPDRPRLRVVEDAIYHPWSATAPWGLAAGGAWIGAGARDDRPGPPSTRDDLPLVDDELVYLGPMTGHYGHFVCDVLSWAWPLAEAGAGRPRLLCHSGQPAGHWPSIAFIRAATEGLGLDPDRAFVIPERAVRIARVVVPEASFAGESLESCPAAGCFVHAVYRDLCLRIGTPIWAGLAVDGEERPVYLSKARLPAGISRIANEPELERELALLGVEIVHPETLPFPEQVRLFATRRTVLASAGSVLHTTMFGPPGRRIVALNWQARIGSHLRLVDLATGNRACYYHDPRAARIEQPGFAFGWRLSDPRRIAHELAERGAAFDELEARDHRDELAARRLPTRLGRTALRLAGRVTRLAPHRAS